MIGGEGNVLRLWTVAVAAFCALTLGAMGVIYVLTSEAPVAASAAPAGHPALAADPAAPSAPLVVLPPAPAAPAPAAPAPYTPPPGVVIETLAPPPPVAAAPEQRAEALAGFREVRRSTAMDQLNAREALRRQRLGLLPPAPLPVRPPPLASARRPRAHLEHATP